MSTNGPGGEDAEDRKTPEVPQPGPEKPEKKKPVGKIALKRKPSRPPWAIDPIREIGPEGLTPVETPKEEPKPE